MKKTFTSLTIALVGAAFLFSSCNKANVKPASFTAYNDSASYAIGALNAIQIKSYIEMDSTMNLQEFIQGVADAAYQKGGKSASYLRGYQMGENFRNGVENDSTIDLDNLLAGFADELNGKAVVTQDQAMEIMNSFSKKMQEQSTNDQLEAEKRILDELANDPDVVTTESGLMYKITELGTGIKPTTEDTVTVHYKGTDAKGEVFDSSYDRNEPSEFALSGVIAGWQEGLQLMPEGSKFILWIPGNLAYGEAGAQAYGPTGLLKFECELIKVTPKQ